MLPLAWRARQYHLKPTFHISLSPDRETLEAWSLYSISYPPKSEERQFLEELKWRLIQICVFCRKNAVGVHAVYGSSTAPLGDTENILFYNIGRWETVSARWPLLRFERMHSIPHTCHGPISGKPIHYYRYQLVPVDSDFVLRGIHGPSLIEFEATCELTDFGEKCGPGPIWLAVCRTMSVIQSNEPRHTKGPYQDRFGARITLTVPASVGQNRSFTMKTIFDGVISALHRYDGPDMEEVANRLAKKLRISQEEVRDLLLSSRNKVLGEYPMVRPHGTGVQFSPKDDLCDAGELRLLRPKITHSGNSIVMHVQVLRLHSEQSGWRV